MRKLISDICKKNKIISKIVRFLMNLFGTIKYSFYKITNKVDDKLVVFEAYQGRNYACSPKEIYLAMLEDEKYKDYKFIWCFKDTNKKIDGNAKIVKYKSKEYYKAFAKAKYWIVNSLIEETITPKSNQIFLQCWHGTPLKRLRHDIEHDGVFNDVKEIRKRNDLDTKRFTYFISPSKFCTEKFTSAFNLKNLNKENIIIEEGYPRNDFLFKYTKEDVKELKKELNLPKNKKIILYAPTFRKKDNYKIDELIKSIDTEKYILIIKLHPYIKYERKQKKGLYYCDDFTSLQLLSVANYLITDYSAMSVEGAIMNIPIYIYAYDYEDYSKNPGINVNLEKEFNKYFFKDSDGIYKSIKSGKYDLSVVTKYRNKYVDNQDGTSCKKLAKYIIKMAGEK